MSTQNARITIMLGTGQQNAWKFGPPGRYLESFDHYLRVAQESERAGVHGIFLADSLSRSQLRYVPRAFEPLTLLSALAARTSRIHFVPTLSTTFNEPYTIARQINSLDNLSEGRFGVNLVTSFAGEENYGGTLPRPEGRYARAREFADVLVKLWTSWDEDAVIADRESGEYFRAGAVNPIDHQGQYFSVAGPLNVPRSPQGIPGIGQSGSSAIGRQLAAEIADFVYTVAPTKSLAADYSTDLRRRARSSRTDGSRPTVLAGVVPIIGDTPQEARDSAARLREPTNFDSGRRALGQILGGIDLGGLGPHDRIDPATIPPPDDIVRRQGRYEVFRSLAVDEGYTLDQLVDYITNSAGHWTVVGTVDEVATELIDRLDAGYADGFNIHPPSYPGGFEAITRRLIPALTDAGYFTPLPDEPVTFRSLFTTTDEPSTTAVLGS